MLPEQAIRNTAAYYGVFNYVPSTSNHNFLSGQWPLIRRCLISPYLAKNWQPETLTGDEWRIAWAEAHDKATDKALDAVY